MYRFKKLLRIIAWTAAAGTRSQVFLGARWVPFVLRRVRASKKRIWALRMLSLSPHYFFDADNPKYRGMGYDEYLETVFKINADSRLPIYEKMLAREITSASTVLDFGCGPGFLAKVAAQNVARLYAVDISRGVIECARILNNEQNIEYTPIDGTELDFLPDHSLDVVYSFAVFQHLDSEALELALRAFTKKLKRDGKLIAHAQLVNADWRTEQDWKNDRSVFGKLKYQFGLHCFGLTEEQLCERLLRAGFDKPSIVPAEDIFGKGVPDGDGQVIISTRVRTEP